jgi:hypothetical protein
VNESRLLLATQRSEEIEPHVSALQLRRPTSAYYDRDRHLKQHLQETEANLPSAATAERPVLDGTPADVVIRAEAPEPELDPTLGIALTPPDGGLAKHRLVAIGDSLTQGVQSLAIFNTSLSYPALIARELGWFDQYRYPTYEGYGGLPFNLELCLRQLERRFGSLNFIERAPALVWLPFWAHRGEHWWTTEAGQDMGPQRDYPTTSPCLLTNLLTPLRGRLAWFVKPSWPRRMSGAG